MIREGFKKKFKKWLDLSNAHLTPASQAERWIKKIQKLHHFLYVFIITKFGENLEEKLISACVENQKGEVKKSDRQP